MGEDFVGGFGPGEGLAAVVVGVDVGADCCDELLDVLEGAAADGLAGDDAEEHFTLAHELGHWVCQCDEGRAPLPTIMCRGADIDEQAGKELEREANRFAATLLMPDDHVTQVMSAALDELAVRFRVSEPAMAWRLFLGPRRSTRALNRVRNAGEPKAFARADVLSIAR